MKSTTLVDGTFCDSEVREALEREGNSLFIQRSLLCQSLHIFKVSKSSYSAISLDVGRKIRRNGRNKELMSYQSIFLIKPLIPPLSLSLQVRAQPLQPFVKPIPRRRARRLNKPITLSQRVKPELIGDFSCVHCIRQILLIRKHKQKRVAKICKKRTRVYGTVARPRSTFAGARHEPRRLYLCRWNQPQR
jgi:hypothetical protein